METRLNNILKTTNATKFLRTFQRAVMFSQIHIIWWSQRGPPFCYGPLSFKQLLTFRFLLYLEKNCEVKLARRLTQGSENTPKIISIGPRITEKLPLKKLRTLSFLVLFISKIETGDIFNFLSVKYIGKVLLFQKI